MAPKARECPRAAFVGLRVMARSMPPPAGFDGDAFLRRLLQSLRRAADRATPDFLNKMPDPYFRDTDEATLLVHLSAVVAASAAGVTPRMILKDPKEQTWTFVHDQSYRGLLADLVEQLPRDQPLASAKIHTATDGKLVLDVFRFGHASRFDESDPRQAAKLAAIVAYARGLGDDGALEELPGYVAQCSADFIMAASPIRIYETWCLAHQVETTDEVVCSMSTQSDPGLARISIVAGNTDTRALFERYVRFFGRLGYDITRAFLDVIRADEGHSVSSIGFVVRDPEGTLAPDSEAWASLRANLKRLRWIDDQVLERFAANVQLGLNRAEVIVTLARLIHPQLARDNPFAFTRNRLFQYIDRTPSMSIAVADVFLARFEPEAPLTEAEVAKRLAALSDRIDDEVDAETARRFWETLLDAVRSVRRTNAYREDRYGMALVVDPSLFLHADRAIKPSGVVFVHADGTDAFHVRFEALARGGLRAICPRGNEQYVLASERLYDEVYDLALAQHLKNKDIPEGGAKAVVLVEAKVRLEAGVKAFVDGLLDLFNGERESERFHLGPDENISAELVEWIIARATMRGYPRPLAFMSGRPAAGIVRGSRAVTSEGVTVFLEEALRAVGIDPRRQSFSVKMTGGPDGEVAGHQIRILHREFGPKARIVGIADASGAAWDPAGLDHDELLRLVEAEMPIACFATERLGPDGAVVSLDAPEGLRRRNRLCFEVRADAFIPAGGRPRTINGENWSDFLHADTPSSRVIVEAANLFITPEARRHLSAAGVLIIKDSSANKCGVISSSYDVAATMVLAPDALAEIRPKLADEVRDKLRNIAKSEAVRLLADYLADPSTLLPDRAVALSRGILRATDAIAEVLVCLCDDEKTKLLAVARAHLPALLVEAAGPRLERLPADYVGRMVASALAARVVYREGLAFVDTVPFERLGRRCLAYFHRERETEALAFEVARSSLPGAARVADLLRAGGARAALALDDADTIEGD